MKFQIKRSSLRKDEKPCEDCEQEEYVDTYHPTSKRKRWVMEINSLEDLIKFKNEQGTLILNESFHHEDKIDSLEIYDDYIE